MRSVRLFAAVLAAAAALSSLPAAAHVVLERREAPAGSYHKAVFRVPHGCSGSPTTAIAVTIPADILVARPQPKPGWQLTVVRQALPQPVKGPHGATIAERIDRIVWEGGSLPDDWFDEFAIQVRLPASPAGTLLHFPVEQTCAEGARHWTSTDANHPAPAPALRLTAGR